MAVSYIVLVKKFEAELKIKRILLYEMFSHGHSVNSLSLLLSSGEFETFCATAESRITLLISDKVACELASLFEKAGGCLCVKTFKTLNDMSSWKCRVAALLYLLRELRGCRYDKVLVMEGDLQCFFAPLLRFFAWRSEILYLIFRPIMHYRSEGYPSHLYRGRRYLAPLMKNWLSIFFYRCHFISGFLFEDMGAVDWCNRRKVKARQLLTPSILDATPHDESSEIMQFTLFGVLSEGKRVSTVLRAWSQVPKELKCKARLQIVGRCVEKDKEDIYNAFDVTDETITFEDRFIENSEVRDLFYSTDVMLLLYSPTHVGGSGVLVQSASYGVPVLVSNLGWIGHTTKRYGLGEVVDSYDEQSLTKVFSRCITEGVRFDPHAASQFAQQYTPDEYAKSFVSILSREI